MCSGSSYDWILFMKRNKYYYLKKVDNIFFLSPSDNLKESDKKLVLLNETSAFLWDIMEDDFTVDELVNTICDVYNVSYEKAYQSVTHFVSFLVENGCLDL